MFEFLVDIPVIPRPEPTPETPPPESGVFGTEEILIVVGVCVAVVALAAVIFFVVKKALKNKLQKAE